jgi:transcriptional regulator with XRE-family HTH domain
MAISLEFGQVLQDAVGRRRGREIAEKTGVSQPYVNQILKGQIPERDTLVRLLDGIGLTGWRRARLFALAGYLDPRAVGDSREELPREVVEVAREMVPLSPEHLDTLRWLIERPQRLEGVARLRDPNDLMGQLLAA